MRGPFPHRRRAFLAKDPARPALRRPAKLQAVCLGSGTTTSTQLSTLHRSEIDDSILTMGSSNSACTRSRMRADGLGSLAFRRAAHKRRSGHLVLRGLDDGHTAMQLLLDSRKLLHLATVVEQGEPEQGS
jgi:hypothetical protein